METDLSAAKALLESTGYTCVMCKGDKVYTSGKRGIKPLVNWLENGTDLKGFCAADKVIGKGAAFLYVLLGVNKVYARVISVPAKEVLESNGIIVVYGELVKAIINREGTGFCPVETALKEINEPDKAIKAIKIKLSELQN